VNNYSLTKAAPGKFARARHQSTALALRLLIALVLFVPFMLAGERHAFPKLIEFCARVAKRWPLLIALLVLTSCATGKPSTQHHNPKPKGLGMNAREVANEVSR
jgi:drug/metabolite transporter (DMT)-like permease